jgi:hypothetical protein
MTGFDVDALNIAGQAPRRIRSGNPLEHHEPRHTDQFTVDLGDNAHDVVAVRAHPRPEVSSERVATGRCGISWRVVVSLDFGKGECILSGRSSNLHVDKLAAVVSTSPRTTPSRVPWTS